MERLYLFFIFLELIGVFLSTNVHVIDAVSPPQPPDGPCRHPLDLVLAIDSSGSMITVFNNTIDFAERLMSNFEITEDRVKVGVIDFSMIANALLPLSSGNNLGSVYQALEQLRHRPQNGETHTDLALHLAAKMFNDSQRSNETPKAFVIITDGELTSGYYNDLDAGLLELAVLKVTNFVVQGGDDPVEQGIHKLASKPDYDFIFHVTPNALSARFATKSLADSICYDTASIEYNQAVSAPQQTAQTQQQASSTQQLAASAQSPAIAAQQPAAATQQQNASSSSQAAAVQQPAAATSQKAPSTQPQASAIQQPAAGIQQQAASTQTQAVAAQQPAAATKQQAASTQSQAAAVQQSAAAIQQLAASTQSQAAAAQQQTASTKPQAVAAQQPPAGTQQNTESTQSQAVASQQQTASTKPHAVAAQQPPAGTQQQTESKQSQAVAAQQPADTLQQKAPSTQPQAAAVQQQAVATQPQTAAAQQPAAATQSQATVAQQLAAAQKQPTSTQHQPAASAQQQSTSSQPVAALTQQGTSYSQTAAIQPNLQQPIGNPKQTYPETTKSQPLPAIPVEAKQQELETQNPVEVVANNCNINFTKVGCYNDFGVIPKPLPTRILEDKRNVFSIGVDSPAFNKVAWEKFLPDFICKCANAARQKKFWTFGIQNYEECYSGFDEGRYDEDGQANQSKCKNNKGQICDEKSEFCAGEQNTNFIYTVLTEKHPGIVKIEYD